MFPCEYCVNFKIAYFKKKHCERLLLSSGISARSFYSNLAFVQPYHLKFSFQNENIKLISKIVNVRKKYFTILIYCI